MEYGLGLVLVCKVGIGYVGVLGCENRMISFCVGKTSILKLCHFRLMGKVDVLIGFRFGIMFS